MVGHYLFVPFPSHGHVNPALPIMAELTARGERVHAVVGREFADLAADVGATPVLLPRDFEVHVPERSLIGGTTALVAAKIRRLAHRRMAFELVLSQACATRPDVVVVDAMTPWARRAAARAAVPSVVFSTTYAGWRCRRASFALVNAIPELQPAHSSLPGRVRLVGPVLRHHDVVETDLPWERIRASRTVLVSPGTVFERGPEFLRAIAWSFAGSDWFVVMATGRTAPADLGPLPENVVARRRVPQLAVLAQSTAFVAHGGMNSALEALAAGVPMVLAPRSREQRTITRHLVELGVGVRLSMPEVRRQAEGLLADQSVRGALDRVRADMRPGGAAEAADLLCAFTAKSLEGRVST